MASPAAHTEDSPQLLAVSVGVASACKPSPPARFCFEDVRLRPLLVLRFDRPLAQGAVTRANYRLSSGSFADVAFKATRVDPVERTVVMALDRTLLPQTSYQLRIKSIDGAAGRLGNQLTSFSGGVFAGETIVEIRTENARRRDEVDQSDADPEKTDPCAVASLMKARCATAGCHGGESPVVGLRLDDVVALDALDGRPSVLGFREASPGEASDISPSDFPRGMPILRRFSASSSFLMFKLLGRIPTGPRTYPDPRVDVPDPTDAAARSAALVGDHLFGRHMPHNAAALTWAELRLVRGWIDQGATRCTK